jgi:hypothetical protein
MIPDAARNLARGLRQAVAFASMNFTASP